MGKKNGLPKLQLKLSGKECRLLRESWSIVIIDNLNSQVINKFYQAISNDNIVIPDNKIRYYMVNASFSPVNEAESASKLSSNNASVDDLISDNTMINECTDFAELYQNIDETMVENSAFCNEVYENLLKIDRQLEITFPSIRHQAVAFTKILNKAILNLEDVKVIDPILKSIGKRHSRILSVNIEQFGALGAALLQTLKERFGTLFTSELEELWIKLYSYLANSLLVLGKDPVLITDEKIVSYYLNDEVEDSNFLSLSITSHHFSDSESESDDESSVEFEIPMATEDVAVETHTDEDATDPARKQVVKDKKKPSNTIMPHTVHKPRSVQHCEQPISQKKEKSPNSCAIM